MANARAFGVIFQKQPDKNGGRAELLLPFGQSAKLLVQDIRLLLAFK